jgi:hypothetical protein
MPPSKHPKCDQCGKRAIYRLQSHLLCLDCYFKIRDLELREEAAAHQKAVFALQTADYLSQEMSAMVGLGPPPVLRLAQPVNASFHSGGNVVNSIDLSKSTVGFLNTGQVKNLHDISVSIQQVRSADHEEVARGLEELAKAIASATDLGDAAKSDALDHLKELSRQAALPPNERTAPAVLKTLAAGLSTVLATGGNLAEMWSAWGPKIAAFLGF